MSQYDPPTDAYRKKPLKERWHRWGNTGTPVQRDAMSAFLACHATEKGHDRALLLEKWTTAEALLSGSGLCRHEPCSDPEVSKGASGSRSRIAKARRNGKEVCRTHFVRTVTFRRLCPLKELSDGQSESSVFRQGASTSTALSLSTRKRNRPIEFRPNQEKGGIRR